VDFDAAKVDLAGAVFDIERASVCPVGGDDLPVAEVEGAGVKAALDLLVPAQVAVMWSPMAALCNW
jgi:hypothetical protein